MRVFYLAAFILACALLPQALASSDTKKLQEAQKMRASGNIAGAINTLRSMSAKQPDNTRVLALLGDSLMESGDPTEAHAMYHRLFCDYAFAECNVLRQIQRMLEVAGGRLSMHGWSVHAFPAHRQPSTRPSSPRENSSYRFRSPPPPPLHNIIHTLPILSPPSHQLQAAVLLSTSASPTKTSAATTMRCARTRR
jgi:hypothetical protein